MPIYALESKYRKLMVENLGTYTMGYYVSRTQVLCSRLCEVQFNLEISIDKQTHCRIRTLFTYTLHSDVPVGCM
jgi:hypothetical protein